MGVLQRSLQEQEQRGQMIGGDFRHWASIAGKIRKGGGKGMSGRVKLGAVSIRHSTISIS
jgi:hypothetical protein